MIAFPEQPLSSWPFLIINLGLTWLSCEMVTPGLPRLGSPSQTAWGRWAWSLAPWKPAGSGAEASLVPEGGEQLWRASLSHRLLLLHCVWTAWEGASGESRKPAFAFLIPCVLLGRKKGTYLPLKAVDWADNETEEGVYKICTTLSAWDEGVFTRTLLMLQDQVARHLMNETWREAKDVSYVKKKIRKKWQSRGKKTTQRGK